MLTLHDFPDSGNGYKVQLVLRQLGIPFRLVGVDILRGESRTAAFLAKNPNGRVPLLELEDGSYLPESNAILYYLATGTPLLPEAPLERARVLSWMFFEQYSHEPYVATSRYILRHLPASDATRAELARLRPRALDALSVMERHLETHAFFAAERYTIADVALYAYTHRAHEAQLELAPYPALRAWLARVEAQPGYVPMFVEGEPAHARTA